ncbi:fimbria/pilus outer membrane usher protein [Dyella sp. M7H15-1]|uniref:fimbria/pilus outer membrane usher protein n=1 Tax=Dyella sp. M7H15-1 TaxID=2501295 RepID=UPI0013E8D4DB|nr:fimbria/pilus outer membrane usher protein [Dyella sp. M7H15-1]
MAQVALGLDVLAAETSPAISSTSKPQSLEFDSETLKRRGIDPKLAAYFRDAPRFPDGPQRVTLFVNGRKRGQLEVPFTGDGQLCFDRALLDKARMVLPEEVGKSISTNAAGSTPTCVDFLAAWPQAHIDLRPDKDEVELIVPTDALREPEQNEPEYATGGIAGLANYDMTAVHSRFGTQTSQSVSANTELGLNAGDWIVRSRQSLNSQDGRTQTQQLLTYAQHTFTRQRVALQVGQIDLSQPIFPGTSIEGAQILPESALLANVNNGAGAIVEGIAHSQARVEVRQNGALIYTTVMPPGAFALRDVPLLNNSSGLEVTVIEADGSPQRFTVPAAALLRPSLAPEGYSLAAGRVRRFTSGDGNLQPSLVSATRGWALGRQTRLSTGALVATRYEALGYGIDTKTPQNWSVSYRQMIAQTDREHVRGLQTSVSISMPLPNSFAIGASALVRTPGYRDLQDTLHERASPSGALPADQFARSDASNRQYSALMSWNHPGLGAFNVNYSRYLLQPGSAYGQRAVMTWSKSFRRANLSITGEWNIKSNASNVEQRASHLNGNAIYATLTLPLGRDSLRTTAEQRDGRQRLGVNYNSRVNDQFNYNASLQRDQTRGTTDVSIGAGVLPRYTQTNATYSRYGSGSSLYTAGLRGGIVAHSEGITFSPYTVQDTFGVASLGSRQAGVKLNTPAGSVWTDAWGRAVVPQLSAYQRSQVDIVAKTLPRDADVSNTSNSVEAARGSVQKLNFNMVRSQRVLIRVITESGRPLAKGNTVVNGADQFITAVGNNGEVFLSGVRLDETFKSVDDQDRPCRLTFALPDKPTGDNYFERIDAQCKPL